MYKLSKPKSYDASPNIIEVEFGTEKREVTNLRKSGITVQSSVLVADSGKWHEIEIESLRKDAETFLENSHLPSFEHYVKVHGITLSDLGIIQEQKTNYGLTQTDFEDLSKQFPIFSADDIRVLNEWEVETKRNWSIFEKRLTLKMIERDGKSIQQYIRENSKYEEVVDDTKPQHELKVDVVKKPTLRSNEGSVSISVIENLSPAKITELTILRAEQEKIAKENPVVVITDKATYLTAKKTKAVLLSASTRVNGKTGVVTLAKQFLNKFKKDFDTAGVEIENITREPHDKQNKLIEDWDNRILLQQQERVKKLCAVPFTYNGDLGCYFIGNLSVYDDEIGKYTDEEFLEIIEKAGVILETIESLKSEQDSRIAAQAKEIEELKSMLAKLLSKEEKSSENDFEYYSEPNEDLQTVIHVEHKETELPLTGEEVVHTFTGNTKDAAEEQKPVQEYKLPHPDNKLLNKLDLDNYSVMDQSSFQLFREGYVQCMRDVAAELKSIMLNENVTKSVEINKLIEIWKM